MAATWSVSATDDMVSCLASWSAQQLATPASSPPNNEVAATSSRGLASGCAEAMCDAETPAALAMSSRHDNSSTLPRVMSSLVPTSAVSPAPPFTSTAQRQLTQCSGPPLGHPRPRSAQRWRPEKAIRGMSGRAEGTGSRRWGGRRPEAMAGEAAARRADQADTVPSDSDTVTSPDSSDSRVSAPSSPRTECDRRSGASSARAMSSRSVGGGATGPSSSGVAYVEASVRAKAL
mmetsp:Transcript_5262/g.11610  ORF Transcript_5262/g.11610 Transcript_5262/m.11610 type:complete len:233 (+) Transcript_5262:248-946(+)